MNLSLNLIAIKTLIRKELAADAEKFGDERRSQIVERPPAEAMDEADRVWAALAGVGIDEHHLAFIPAGSAQDDLAQIGKAHRQLISDAVDHHGGIRAPGNSCDPAGEGQA